jgi:hypothetical protein
VRLCHPKCKVDDIPGQVLIGILPTQQARPAAPTAGFFTIGVAITAAIEPVAQPPEILAQFAKRRDRLLCQQTSRSIDAVLTVW